ncbi:MAG: ATP synthase F1 subunit delta [Candidatus Omnitrophica bacterium]|nr:ATP synthase F1 subunit delta [Candidatus Omnitrophota bacterium]
MSKIIADRYARAFYEQTEKAGTSGDVKADMDALRDLHRQSAPFARLLTDPVISATDKKQVLTACFTDKLSPPTLTFLDFLAEKKRLALLPIMAGCYVELYLDARGQLPASIESKVPLTESQVGKIRERFRALMGADIIPEMIVNPDMLGGFRVKIRNTIYDHTVESKLLKFKRSIINY